MRIGEVARKAGVGVETIRFYEKKGLVPQPPRPRAGGYREYHTEAVHRISFLRGAQRLGFSLNEIAELLELESGKGTKCTDVRQRAEAKRKEVQAKIDNLRMIKTALDRLIEACPGAGPARNCSILDAINAGELDLGLRTIGEIHGQ
jgi:MerR family copper efflux transcriptional regulator